MQQMPVDKYQRVVFIICHPIVIGNIFVYFQSQAILVIVKTVLFLLILGEIVGCPVSVCILQVCLLLVRLDVALQLHLLHPLHHIQVYPGTKVHPQALLTTYIVILLPILHGIAAVVGQIQGDRVYRGGVGYQVFTQGQLTAEVPNVCRTGIANSHGLIGIVVLDAVGAPVGSHKVHLAVVGEPGAVLGTGIGVGSHHQTVIAPTIVPLFRGGCNIPEQNVVDGGIAGIHIVQRGPVRRAVGPGQAAVQGGTLGNFAHIQHH